MVVKEEKQRLHRLLADAIPLLCKSGLPLKATFCIEALIGITLEEDEVMLISFKHDIRDDHPVPQDERGQTEEEESIAVETVPRSSLLPTSRQNERLGNSTLERKMRHKAGKKTSPEEAAGNRYQHNSIDPGVKAEHMDVKMEDDVEIISASGFSVGVDSQSWNICDYSHQAALVSAEFMAETAGGTEKESGVSPGGKRTGNGRNCGGKTGKVPNASMSVPASECAYLLTGGSTCEWNKKRKDGSGASAAARNSSSLSFLCDAGFDRQPSESAAGVQDPLIGGQNISDAQLPDDRVSLEQTCKILSSYRFMNSDENLYSCHICEAKLRGRQTLYEHIRGTHLCAHIYRCPNCGQSFKWRSGLQRHRARCTGALTQVSSPSSVDT